MTLRSDKLLLTKQEAAEALGLSVDTVSRLIALDELRVVRIGQSVRVRRADLMKFVQRDRTRTRRPSS